MASAQRRVDVPLASSSALPPTTSRGTSSSSSKRRRYELIVRQQPQRGRQCALGSRERRPIDPPPICQLLIHRPDGTIDADATTSSVYCVQALLIPASQHPDPSADPSRQGDAISSAEPSSSSSTAPPLPPSIPKSNAAAAEARATPSLRDPATTASASPQSTDHSSPSASASSSASPKAAAGPMASSALRTSSSSSMPTQQPQSQPRPPPAPPPATRRLEGKTYSSGHVVKDLDGQSPACFFVFPDLSIRDEGLFSLQFSLIRLIAGPGDESEDEDEGEESGRMEAMGSAMQSMAMDRTPSGSADSKSAAGGPVRPSASPLAGSIVASATSVVFENYSPRRFPGSLESTPLTRALAGQGVLAPIRNYSTSAAPAASTAPAPPAAVAAAAASMGLSTGPSSVASGTASTSSSRRGSAASTGRGI